MIEKMLVIILGILILIYIAIPITDELISNTTTTVSTILNEQFNGTAGVEYTPTEYLASVTSFAIQTIEAKHNGTAVNAINSTRTLNLTTPIGMGFSNLTVTHNNVVTNTTVHINGYLLGQLTASTGDIWSVPTSYLAAGNTINVTYYDNSTRMNITNISLSTPYWATSTAYSTSGGKITPTASGDYLMSYNYAIPTTGVTLLSLMVLPVLLAMLALIIVANELNLS